MEIPACNQEALEGKLYVVATPIGNLSDISVRAATILATASHIACEDTRVTQKLLSYLGIKPKNGLISYRDHNEAKQSENLVELLKGGASVALVSDAGTPAISDPGFDLVRLCHKEGVEVVAIPGACAFVGALSSSGLPSNDFRFVGFLAPKSAARVRFFESHRETEYTLVLYESCHRMEKFMKELLELLGPDRVIAIGRELTKKFETILVGSAERVNNEFMSRSKKGEFVVLIAPKGFEL